MKRNRAVFWGLALVLVGIQTGLSQCARKPSQEIIEKDFLKGRYYEIYDRAISLYFKQPRDPEKALALMRAACEKIRENRALTCYNAGILLELRGEVEEAVQSYRRAAALSPHPFYRAAVQDLEPGQARPKSPYLRKIRVLLANCGRNNVSGALKAMRELSELPPALRPPRSALLQPYIRSCLKKKKGRYRALLRKFRQRSYKRYSDQYYKTLAQEKPYFSLWDMELHLRKIGPRAFRPPSRKKSAHPLTRAWNKTLQTVLKKDVSGARESLEEFYRELTALRRGKAGRGAGASAKIRALGRASALLVLKDKFFRPIQKDPAVQKIVRPWLR